jgi:hypothetical protein
MPVQFPIIKKPGRGVPGVAVEAEEPGENGKKKGKELMLLRDFRYACATFLLL